MKKQETLRDKVRAKLKLVASNPVPKKGPQIIKRTKGSKTADVTLSSTKYVPKQVSDLKGASYNPRVITEAELKRLKRSMEEFGDLSGVVFNVASKVLISGHQRLKTTKGKKTRLVREKTSDGRGTVAVGRIEVKEADGNVTIIPYREVNWNDRITEMAANIAANAHGGDFDQIKLGGLLTKISQNQFDIELTGVHEFEFQKALIRHSKQTSSGGKLKPGDVEIEDDKSSGKKAGFDTFSPKDIAETKCKCPRCGFRFDPT